MKKMLSPHFSHYEIACRCGCGFDMVSPRLLGLAEKVRECLNEPMIVHSVCRCPDWNKKNGGASRSQHMFGRAMDFHCKNMPPIDVYRRILAAEAEGLLPELGAVLLYNWGVHIDIRPRKGGALLTRDFR